MNREKGKNIIIGLLIVIIILLVIIIGLVLTDKINVNSNNDVTNKNDAVVEENDANIQYEDYEDTITVNENETYTVKYDFTEQSDYSSNVPDSDKKVSINQPEFGKQLYILKDGTLYYLVGDNVNLDEQDIENMEEYSGLNNIKRVKSTNLTTGVDTSLLLITDEGLVFTLRYDKTTNDFDLNQIIEFSKYKIDDITEYKLTVPTGTIYTVIFQDGTILEKSIIENK